MASTRDGDRTDWLDQVKEPVIDPERVICDPHHHLWDRRESRYELDELGADARGGGVQEGSRPHRVESTVFVECMSEYLEDGPQELRPTGETSYVAALAEQSRERDDVPTIAGIVGFADLELGTRVAPVLERHLEIGGPLFKGIRHAAGWHASDEIRNSHTRPSEHLLLDDDFRTGFEQLGRFELSFDAWLYHYQIPELTDLARAFPEIPIVLDHLGGPLGIGVFEPQREQVFGDWRTNVTELAVCPNVSLKFGGMLMPINGFGFHRQERPPSSETVAATLGVWFETCLELFGPQRTMLESNFPVDRVSCSYGVLWNAFKRLAESLSDDEQELLFRGTAQRFYRLD